MNDYEQRQQARRERLLSRSASARSEGQRRFGAARATIENIPPGQPILVGHHSESGHRAALKRHDQNMRKGIEAERQAEQLAQRAQAVGTGGISSDDPAAVDKLQQKLDAAQALQELMRAINSAMRAGKKKGADAQIAAMAAVYERFGHGKTDDERRLLAAGMLKPDFCGRVGYADYQLSNNNAEIRRLTQRIASLKATRQQSTAEFNGAGYVCREDVEENRVMFIFDRKPEPNVREILKRHSFKWSPSREAWVRQLTNAAKYDANQVRHQLDALAAGSAAQAS